MPITTLLPQASTWSGLRRLLAALEVRGTWHPLDPQGFESTPAAQVLRMAALDAQQTLPWITLSAREGKPAARAIARARAALGRPAGIACLDAERRRLVLTVAIDRPPVLELSLDQPDPAAVAALERITSLRDLPPLEAAARLAEFLAIEPVGARFFRQFRHTCEQFHAAMPAGPSTADRRALALLQLTRVLFLYFVQSKGWLDQRPDFIARAVDDCLGRRRPLHRDLLRPLFFGALNRPLVQRGIIAKRFGKVPFLNGGLFEPHQLERRWKVDIPTAAWRDAFDTLFEAFHFTTREGDGSVVAPDMLGRVFEGLMDTEQRHRSGTFYTPASLVERLVDTAISVHTARSPVPLADCTLLDPAVGSGAFLLGALERIACLTRDRNESASAARRRVLSRNLFGVDLDPTAVRLAELRLWLAVIADDETTDPEAVPPLPNLDAVVRQGDTLWSRQGTHRIDNTAAADLRRARHVAITAAGGTKRGALRALRRAEEAAESSSLAGSIEAVEGRIDELLALGRSTTLFGEQRGLAREERSQLKSARVELRELRAARRRLAREGGLSAFDYSVHFADVMAAGGFDLVVGNPPWVRSEALPRALRHRLAERYRWFRPAGTRGYQNYPDLSVAFVERGLELTREGGVVALLIPAKLRHAGYAARLRQALVATTALHVVADMPSDDAKAFDATVYPMALVARKDRPEEGQRTGTSLEAGGPCIRQASLAGDGPWTLAGDVIGRVAERLGRECESFGVRWQCALGVKTGADDVYLTREPDIEPHLMRRAVRGRDIKPGTVTSTRWIRWPCDEKGNPLRTLPPRAAAYFRSQRDRLSRRADYREGPPWTLFRTRAALGAHRVVWPDLARRLEAAALTGYATAFIPMNTCYVLNAADGITARTIAALLNTTWLRALAAVRAPLAASGFRRFNARVIEELPLPPGALDDTQLLEAATAPFSGDSGMAVDERVASLLDLTLEERHALSDIVAVHRC
jgi:hypothetical protein